MSIAPLALLVCVSYVITGSSANEPVATARAFADDNGSASFHPDFDGDRTIGFGDFVLFAGAFGSSQVDEKYDANYNLNGDGEIGYTDFVTLAQDFGKEVPSPVVIIPDANLRATIEVALGEPSGVPINPPEIASLDSLAANGMEISNLTGLESATSLTRLSLGHNIITDIAALAGLTNLEFVNLESNQISDISHLASNTGLESGDTVNLVHNPRDVVSTSTGIPVLRARGVLVAGARDIYP